MSRRESFSHLASFFSYRCLVELCRDIHSGGSNLSPDQLLEARINEVPIDQKILVYCRTGHRSTSASQMLVAAGYPDVYNMQGEITAWTGAGYPVVSSAGQEIDS